jgi:hypothetical protein
VNIQRTLGNIGDYYADDVKLPLELAGGNNKVLNLNEHDNGNGNGNDDDEVEE